MNDTITVAQTIDELALAKIIHGDGKVDDYSNARYFNFTEHMVSGLSDITALLHGLAPAWQCAVLRGEVIGPHRGVRRLIHLDQKTGDEPTLRAVPRHWLALDVDGVALPPGVPAADLAACATLATAMLPAAFHGAAVVVQATATHGIKPGARLRLWYWLSRPMSAQELKRWLAGRSFDSSVFSAAQLIYTATPGFIGRRDHLPCRLIKLPGFGVVQVPSSQELAARPHRRLAPNPHALTAAGEAGPYADAALVRAAQCIMEAPEGARHGVLIRVSALLSGWVQAGALPEAIVREVVLRATAGWDNPDAIEAAVTWGLSRTPPLSPFLENPL